MKPLHLRVPIAIIGVAAATLSATGLVAVNRITALARDRVHQATLDLVEIRAKEIEGFFRERGRVVRTVFSDPTVLEWFAAYDEPRRPLDDDPQWRQVQGFFRALPATDPSILSVFFATEDTGEYFRDQGRVERAGYDPKQRWWWAEALEKDRLYVSPPGVDAGTGDIAVTIQSTFYRPDGRLLGVGGIDVLLGTLGALVERIRYEGVGHGFLVNERGDLIYFPELDLGRLAVGPRLDTPLASLDELLDDADGFAEVAAHVTRRERGLHRVRWQGEERIVVVVPVRAGEPELDWTLGLMVPQDLLTSAIARARRVAALAVALGVAIIAGLTLWVTTRVNDRLREQDRERARTLAEANARLLEADQMKSLFLANMSHELRTPLNSIIGFSQVLRTRLGDRLEPRYLRFLDNIHASGNHLLTMIGDILDLSKVEAGRLELQLETLEVRSALEAVVAIVQGIARDRGIAIAVDIGPDVPRIEADPVRVKQILLNLLSNAIKFSDEGSPIRISVDRLDAEHSPLGVESVAIAVADRGIGIATEHQAMIFEQFRQVDAPGARRHGGTGLGLALVRHLVDLHHGAVSVSSELGKGSTFTVALPVRGGHRGPTPGGPSPGEHPRRGGMPA